MYPNKMLLNFLTKKSREEKDNMSNKIIKNLWRTPKFLS